MADDHYNGALLEEINDKLTAIMEGQAAMSGVPSVIAQLQDDMVTVKGGLEAIKAAVTDEAKDQTARVDEHDSRITRLEQASA